MASTTLIDARAAERYRGDTEPTTLEKFAVYLSFFPHLVAGPITGDVVGTWPLHTAGDVEAAVQRAREAASWWSALTFDERAEHLHPAAVHPASSACSAASSTTSAARTSSRPTGFPT